MAQLSGYGFNEGTGTTTADATGNGRNLTVSGGWAATAKTGAGLGSGGATSGVIGAGTLSAFTVMAWVKLSLPTGGNYYGIATSAASSGNGYYFEVAASGAALLLDCYNGTTTVNASSTFPVNTATHVAMTLSGGTTTLYINGVAAGSSGSGTSQNFGAADWHIGAGNGNIGPGASDWIDEFKLFDTALTAGQIVTEMNTAIGGSTNATLTVGAARGSGRAAPVALSAAVNATLTVGAARGSGAAGAAALAGTSNATLTVGAARGTGRAAPVALNKRFVASIAAGGRYFTDAAGQPLLIRGYFAWSGIADWSPSQADTYLDHVQAQGGNTILMEAVAVDGDGGGPNASGATYDGVSPFVGGDVTVFNAAYWARLDLYLAKAAARGLSVVLYPMDGWNTGSGKAFDGATTGECQTYGQTLATRYLSRPGIMWGFGGDYTPDGGTVDAQFNACLTGIRAAGDTRPATIQLDYYKSLSTDSSYWESRVQYNFVYTYYVQYKGVLDGYRRSPGARDPRPSMWMEGRYEGEGGGPGEPTVIPEVFRKQELWSLTSGSPGVFYGSADWNFPSGWEGRLGTTTETELRKARAWFAALPWHTLEPDDLTAFVTAGRGTKITTDSATWPGSNDYVTAARSADGSLAVVYVPSNSGNTARTITLDMSLMGASPAALWVDPTDATSTQTATINGSNQTTTPGTHGDGTRDWLLLITASTSTPATLPVGAARGAGSAGAVTLSGVINGGLTVGAARGAGQAATVALSGVANGSLPVSAARGAGAAGAVSLSGVVNGGLTVGPAHGSGSAGSVVLSGVVNGDLVVGAAGGSGAAGAVALSGQANVTMVVGAAGSAGAAGAVVLFAGQSATLTVGAAGGSGSAGPVALSGVRNVTLPVGAAQGSGQAGSVVLAVLQPDATLTVGAPGATGRAGSVTIGATQSATLTVGPAGGTGQAGQATLSGVSNATLTVGAARGTGQAGPTRLTVPDVTMLVGAAQGAGRAGAVGIASFAWPSAFSEIVVHGPMGSRIRIGTPRGVTER